ncbi:hypothetical protein [Candidatus Accumulibacter sp. ACC003]|uniref:hypothetical protein n=1 Tax=Candidatus Accumulibacter sp. ACC003 TaxID=2823334 RepID=UPI0025C307AC|nr:hypothetical protein [Candidatus Accumulibacter sp. ACC003]
MNSEFEPLQGALKSREMELVRVHALKVDIVDIFVLNLKLIVYLVGRSRYAEETPVLSSR